MLSIIGSLSASLTLSPTQLIDTDASGNRDVTGVNGDLVEI